MRDGGRGVLLAGLDDALARRVVVALDSMGLRFHRTTSLARMVGTVRPTHFAVIVLAYAQDRMGRANRDEIQALSDSCGRCTASVMLCSAPLMGQARAWLDRGISRVVAIDAIAQELRATVATLIGVAPRVRLRASVRMALAAAQVPAARTGRTVNISSSGMLVSCPDGIAVGHAVRFEIALPTSDLTIQGLAQVVRTTDPAQEGVRGIGARFTSFVGPGAVRLHEVLSRQTH